MALADEQGFPREGGLDFLDNQLDPATGTIRGRARLPNRDGSSRRACSSGCGCPAAARTRGVLVQDRAVGTDLDKRFVLVVGARQDVEYRAGDAGPMVDGLRVVRSGLDDGERVVVNGLQRVRPGVKVDADGGDGRRPSAHAAGGGAGE